MENLGGEFFIGKHGETMDQGLEIRDRGQNNMSDSEALGGDAPGD